MKIIHDILNHKNYTKLSEINLKEINLKEYQSLLESKLSTINDSDYNIAETNLLISFMTSVMEQNPEQKNALEEIHYNILLQWVSKNQKETLVSIMVGKEIVAFLIKNISLEKLNKYNERTQNSILKQVLLRYENNALLQIFIDNGLKIESIEGLNPYYYNLLNGKSTNMLIQMLYQNNIPVPKGYWSYIFENMANGKIDKTKDYLLYFPDKEFIINEYTQECVWNVMINHKQYELITYIPEEFYKPHKVNEKSIFEVMVEKKDFKLIHHIGTKMINLLEPDEEVSDMLCVLFHTKESRDILIKEFLYELINEASKTKHNTNKLYIELKKEWDNLISYNKINQLSIIKQLVITEMKKCGDKIDIQQEDSLQNELMNIDTLINIYKKRSDFSESVRKQMLMYFKFIGEYEYMVKPSETFYKNNQDFIDKLLKLSQHESKKTNINQNIFEKILCNTEENVFSCLAEEAFNYLKEFKLPDMSKVYEKIADFSQKEIDIFTKTEGGEILPQQILHEEEMKKSIEKIEILAGATKVEAQLTSDNIIKDLKQISKYPNIVPKSVHEHTFLALLGNLNFEEDTANEELIDKIMTELNTPMVEKVTEDTNKENVEESELSPKLMNQTMGIYFKSEKAKNNIDEELKIELFTNESLEKFKKNNQDTTNEKLRMFVNNIAKVKKNNQKKTLAKASVLLENIQNLYETFPHFENVIKHIENLMILQDKGDKSFYVPPLLLGGGPGVGKTFFCSTLSKLVNTHFELLNMESMTANFILTGSSAQWGGADTGKIFKSLFNEENKNLNPIFLLDELEKASGSSSYGVMNSLLPLLERYTAKKFKDECIPLEMDASYINWFATANDLDKLSAPIKSRFDIFNIPNPTPEQRKSLIKGIYKTVRENNSWGQYFDEVLPTDSLEVLANLMAPGAARDLRKSITMACSKAIREESKIILPKHIERHDNGEIMPWDIIG